VFVFLLLLSDLRVFQHNYSRKMEDNEDDTLKFDSRLQMPMLSENNWNSVWKEMFLTLCLNYGDAGDILIEGVDKVIRQPDFERDTVAGKSSSDPVRRKYEESDAGMTRFEKDLARYNKLKDQKKKLLGKMLNLLERPIREKLTTQEGYGEAFRRYDVLAMWKLLERVVQGSGTVSIYQHALRLLRMRQVGAFQTYVKEFREIVSDLNKLKNEGHDVLAVIIDTLFTLGLNQEQFKDLLKDVYSKTEWPKHDVFAVQCGNYLENTTRVENLQKDNNDGKIAAHAVSTEDRSYVGCYNCGSTRHLRAQCTKPPVLCESCGRHGHMGRYCRYGSNTVHKDGADNGRSRTEARDDEEVEVRKSTEKKSVTPKKFDGKVKAKTFQRRQTLKKAIANLAARIDELEVDESDEEEYYDEENEDEDENDAFVGVVNVVNSVIKESEDEVQALVKWDKAQDDSAIVDSGCNKRHIIINQSKMQDPVPHSSTIIQGISGHQLRPTHEGTLPGLEGRALCVPQAEANLLSLKALLQSGGKFNGDSENMFVYDSRGKLIVHAKDNGDGFWRADLSAKVTAQEVPISPYHANEIISKPRIHLTAEEISRAKAARDLCNLLGHPGQQAMIDGLNNNAYGLTPLNGQDVRNALNRFGPCPACLEGKMHAPSFRPSQSPPATSIGEHLHADLIPLNGRSIGGNTFILYAVDETGGFGSGVCLTSKERKSNEKAFDSIISEYESYGHKVKFITTDDEATLAACKPYLASRGIHLSPTPAGHHEKTVERSIQTLKGRKRAMLAALAYELPPELDAEAYMTAIKLMNCTVNSASGVLTPHQLVTGQRPTIPPYYFGQTGLFYSRNKKNPEMRAHWGILTGFGDHNGYLRAWAPGHTTVLSRMKFVPHPAYPAEWKLKPRIKIGSKNDSAPPGTLPLIGAEPRAIPEPLPPTVIPLDAEDGQLATAPRDDDAAAPRTPSRGAVERRSLLPPPPGLTSTSPMRLLRDPVDMLNTNPDMVADAEGDLIPKRLVFGQEGELGVAKGVAGREGVVGGEGAAAGTSNVPTNNSDVRLEEPIAAGDVVPEPTKNLPQLRSSLHRTAKESGWQQGPAKYKGVTLTKKQAYKLQVHMANVAKDPHGPGKVAAFRLSIRMALKQKERYNATVQAIHDEIGNMVNNKVMKVIRFRDIPKEIRRTKGGIIQLFPFIKDKFKADGTFDKSKCRLVANGGDVDMTKIGETFSPTVNPISVMTQLNIAAKDKAELAAYDVKGAFLLTPIVIGKRIFVRLSGEMVTFWLELYPDMAQYLHDDGCLYFELNKYIYGLPESPHEFNNLLDKRLRNIGLVPTRSDKCMYTLQTEDGRIIVSAHVDDMLVTTTSRKLRKWFEYEMEKHFELVKQYDTVSYLGMSISRSGNDIKKHDGDSARPTQGENDIKITQQGFVEEILTKYGCLNTPKPPKTPAASDLFEKNENSPLCDQKKYLSLVMTLMYLARYTRPDILLAVTVLASRCSAPSDDDMGKAMRVVRYLAGTREMGLCLRADIPLVPKIYADASHGVHPDGKGHGGIFMTLGSSPVHSRSFKLKAVTRSSTESELYALEEASTYAEWWSMLLEDLGAACNTKPIRAYQDNQSTIVLATQGASFKRTKHILIKGSYVKERIEVGDIELKYLPTGQMPADLLTKPLAVYTLQRLLQLLCII